ncbi:MAG TPA: bifunctional serine/threonine-protein kinase/formylglycine-generating enzyme family protein [Pyrinomonadaceae bacterium]|nr:bifunctional serine/threonine-protein kinase/formylglycine-generating enzyme family protein [Pyrinomonadaceae bacterium]
MKECPACHRCFADQVNHCPSDGDRLKFLINLDTTLDERYLLERKLGQGGMGLVFKAHHKFIKTQHAIKVILPDLVGNDPSLAARFRQEAMAAAAIRHPNTVSVTDYGILQGTTPYLVMEFVEGRSLHDILSEQRRLSPVAAVEIMLAVCAGVAAAHRQGIVHRDLKPLNIMFRPGEPPGESLKVLDFGLAKIKSGELLGSFVAAQTQGMMGSPFYMAPEQWSDEDIDVRADIYSLGVILYQMIAGDVPFKGKSVPSIMSMHLNAAPVPLAERGIDVPPALERAIQHALEKDPNKRPQSVDEFVAELREAMPQLGGGGDLREPGATTVQIGPSDTMGLKNQQAMRTGLQAEGIDSLKTVASMPDALSTGALEAGPEAPVTAAEPPADGEARAADGPDTGRQTPAETGGPFGVARPTSAQLFPQDAMTEPLSSDTFAEAEEERRRAESLRRRQEEEEQRRQAEERERREAEERQRLEAEARARREQEERQRREFEESQRREFEERQRREAEERQRREAEGRAAAAGAAAPTPDIAPPGVRPPGGGPTTTGSNKTLIVVSVVILLGLLAGVVGLGYFAYQKFRAQNSGGVANANGASNVNTEATPTPAPSNQNAEEPGGTGTRADLLWIPGGTFQMGRADVPPVTDELKATRGAYLLWVYSQWPAHEATVGPFAIDRTEVTNAEYAEFVKETGHKPPPGIWDGARPNVGEERLPVSNVSYDDANAFAAWRSKRDGVTYRLPTEEEWEFAARGGDNVRMYPWGGEWLQGYANLEGAGPAPVGSFPLGRTPQGVEDMIGNVWEWTASEASMYKGNDRTSLASGDRGKLVARGGSFKSRPDGDEPITVTARRWIPRNFRDPVLGFRLVRAER